MSVCCMCNHHKTQHLTTSLAVTTVCSHQWSSAAVRTVADDDRVGLGGQQGTANDLF